MPLPDDLKINSVDSVEDAVEMMRWLRETPRTCLAFDLETSGLDHRDPGSRIRLAQLGDRHTGWAVPWDRWSGVFLQAINEWDGPLVAHNAAFDVRWLQHFTDWKAPFHRLDDTMIMAQVCENHLNAGLKDVGDRHIDRRASSMQKTLHDAMKAQKWTWDTVPMDYEPYLLYSCLDTVLTAHVYDFYLEHPAFVQEAYNLEMAARRVVSLMEDNGIVVDLEYCREKIDQLEQFVAESNKWAKDTWGINIGSSPQVAKFYQEELGQAFTVFTPGGAPSTAKEQMEIFAQSDDELVKSVTKFIDDVKKATKTKNSYFKNFIDMSHDGVLHTSFKTNGAQTGRMSATKPALQTITKKDGFLRNSFIPHPGQVLISCDYSSMEGRLMAHYADDEAMIEAYRVVDEEDGDFFVELGKNIYSEPNFIKADPRRDTLKTYFYATIYGASPGKLAKTLGMTEQEIMQFINQFNAAYPGIKNMQKKVIAQVEKRERLEGLGYVVLKNGRQIKCHPGEARKAPNYLLQGTGALVTKEALVRLDKAGLSDYLLLAIHDEVIASVPEDDWQRYADEIQEIMTVKDEFRVPLPAEAEGPLYRWGEKYAK